MRAVLLAALPPLAAAVGGCPNACSKHGRCNGRQCICTNGYTGYDCSERKCAAGIAWASVPTATDTAHTIMECSNAGTCDRKSGACKCDKAFSGIACERMACPAACSDHGRCMSMKEAAAANDGHNLVTTTTYDALWDAEKIYGCVCDWGWTGHTCGLRVCPLGDDPMTVSQVDEQQTVTCVGTSGTYWLTFRTFTTDAIAHDASAATVKAALEALSSLGTVSVAFNPNTVSFTALQGGVGTTVETSDAGANSAIFTVFNTGSGSYTFAVTTAGTNYNSLSTVTFAALQGGVGTTVETSGAGANSAIVTVYNTGSGSYTFAITTAGSNYDSDTTETYAALQGGVGTTVETSDAGANSAIVTIFNTGSGSYTFAVTTAGTNYNSDATVGDNTADKIVILGTSLGGATPANDCTLTVTGAIDFADFNAAHVAATETSTAGAGSAIVTVHTTGSGGAYSFTITAAGTNYASGDTLVILGTSLGGATPLNDCTITTNAVGGFAGTAAGTPAAIGATGVTSLSSANLAITGTPVATSADKIVILGTLLGGATPANDCTLTVTGATGATGLSTSNVAATGTPVVITGTVETSDAGANSAIFTIHNTGSGAYTFTVTTAGTNYNSDTSSGDNTADKIVVLGTHLGGTTPANDCTLTVTGSAGAAVLSSANVAVTGTPIARTIRANASAAHISITELAKGTHVPHGDKSRYESSGAAYVFERINGTSRGWIERAKLRPHEPASQNGQSAWDSVLRSRFGHAVAITEDVIFVGAPSEGSGAGAAYIFERRGAGHRPDEPALPPFYTPEEEWLQVQRIGAGGAIEESTVHREPKAWARGLGAAGAMHSEMLVIAAPGSGFGGVNGAADAGADIGGTASSRVGKLASAIYVLRRTPYGPASSVSPSGMSYVLDQTLFATTDNTGFGASVAVLANTIVVGAPFYQRDVPATALPYGTGASRSTEQGAVFVFRRWRDDTAFELHQILTASDGIPGARLGLSTALTARGDVVMAGASERMASGALVPRAAVQTVTTRSTGTALGGTFVLTWKQRRAVASKVDAGSEFHDEREWCYPKSDVPCHEDEMRFRCVLCPSSAVPGGNAGVMWRPQATKRLAHNIRAEELSVELMKLGTGALSIVRSAADSRGGFTWSITFLGLPGQVAAPIDTMYSELTCGASGTCSASARIVKQPPPAARGSVYVWTDEAAHSVTKTSKYVEQAILLPNAYQQADLFGGGGLAAHGEVVLAGALNRDSFVSGVNAGATYAFSLDFLNFRFGQLSYAFEEDTNNATVFVHRCDGGGDKWNAYQGCRVGPQNDRGLGVQRTSVIGYATGDSASASHAPASILRREFAHVPVGTARGRAECFANSSLADDCMWILDPAVGNISTFDESAISDYVPDAAEMSFASGITVSPLVVWLTNDAHVEVPDESFHLRLNLPGMIPSYGGSLWTTITIVDDGDGGHGSRDYFERLLPPPAYSAWEKKAAADAKSYDPSTSAYADDTASGYVDWQEMGSAVEIDNNTAIVGAPRSAREGAKSVGSAFSYFRYSGVWSRKQVFVPPAGAIAGGLFGSAVSIRDSIALVGASGLARVYVYEFQGTARWSGTWVHTATLRPPTPAEATALGGDAASWAWSLLDTTAGTAGYSELAYGARGTMALSNDRGSDAFGGGSRYWWAAIGSLKCEAVFVYQRISAGGSWSLRQIVRSNDVAGVTLLGTSYLLRPAFGTSVAMSGRTIVIGAPREDAARHFNNTVAPGTAPHDEVAPAPFNGKGAVYVFYLQDVLGMNCEALYPGGDSTCEATFRWKQHKKLVATALTAGDQFGSAVALDNDQLIVGCRASNAVPPASWDFEMGDLRGWTLTGTAFDNQPTLGDNTYARNVYGENLVTSFKTKAQDWLRSPVTTFHGDPGQRIGQQGRFWVGTYENRRTNATVAGAVQGDAPVGTLTSPPFIVGGSLVDAKTGKRASEAIRSTLQIGFLIGGGCRAEETFVELLVDGEDDPLFTMRTPAQPGQGGTSNAFSGGADALGQTSGFSVLRATGRCEESMRRVWWNVSSFAGRSARLRIVDTSTTAWGHINFDDVLFSWHGPGLAMQGGLGMSSGSTDLGRGQSGQAGAVYAFRRKTEVVGSEEVCACVCNSFGCSCDGTKWGCVWQEESKLEASDKRSGDLFGFAVDVDDASGVVVVGAPGRSGTDQVSSRLLAAACAVSNPSFARPFHTYRPSSPLVSSSSLSLSPLRLSLSLQFNYNNARSTRERTFTESGGVYVFTRIPTRRDGLGVMLRQPSWSRARALAGARQDLQIGLEQMLLQDNTGKENRRRLGSDVSVDGCVILLLSLSLSLSFFP